MLGNIFMFKGIIIRVLTIMINLIILVFLIIIPKSNKIWLIGGWFGERFADNSRYFFLYLNDNKKNIGIDKVVWVTRNKDILKKLRKKGFEAYYVWELKSIWYHFRAKVHIIDQAISDINPFFTIGSIRINLWHGFPLKKINGYTKENIKKKGYIRNKLIEIKKRYNIKLDDNGLCLKHYLLATSKFSAKILGKAFNMPKERILIAGYPRDDIFFTNEYDKYLMDDEKQILKVIDEAKNENKIVISYLPTFRDNKTTYLFGTENKYKLTNFFNFLEKYDILLINKFHFVDENNYKTFSNYSNTVINLSPEMDIYFILKYTNILITDYSSVYFDFLLLDRSIIFYPYDLEYFRNEDRGLNFDYNEFTPGPKAYNLIQLKKIILKTIEINKNGMEDIYKIRRNKLNKKINNISIDKMSGSEFLTKEIIKNVLK